jgi:hypothetical protein
MNFITSSERSLVHEVGHMKLSKSVFDDDKAVIKIGLLTQNVPVFEKFSVGKNDELILLNAANVSETGRGLEEFLNEIESRDIDNKESYFTSFGIILELILGKDAQQARHDMNLDKIINLIRLISPSKAKACNLVKLLDSYYNKRVINEFYDETDEVRIYAELSDYIVSKIKIDIKNGTYNKQFLEDILNWKNISDKNIKNTNLIKEEIRGKVLKLHS